MTLYLASKSPRRQELLTQMQIKFAVLAVDTPEMLIPGETPEAYSLRITQEKLEAAWKTVIQQSLPQYPVLCADTEVVIDERIMGKPRDYQDAFQMLSAYSGRSHQVLTSIGIRHGEYQKILMNQTNVTIAKLSDQDIHHYLALGDYQDKAGAYGIQGYFGQFISRIDGCFYAVMGLPLHSVRELLRDLETQFL